MIVWSMFGFPLFPQIPTIGKIDTKGAFYCSCPDDVRLYEAPWLSNSKVIAYKGPTEIRTHVETISDAFYCIDDLMREKAFEFDCNSVIGYERELHPWEDPMVCIARGTLAILEPVC